MKSQSIAALAAAAFALPSLGNAAGYTQKYLSADVPGVARHTDSLLQNPWGLSVPPEKRAMEAFWWAADNASGVSTLYGPKGATRTIANPGLWAITFGIGNHNNGPTNVLYFNSGTESQTHGVFGSITANRF
jgi:hypothetical protein